MKFYLFMPFCFLFGNCLSQSRFKEGSVKIKSDTFIVKRQDPGMKLGETPVIFVHSSKNKHVKLVHYTGKELEISKNDIHIDRDAVRRIFFEVLKDKLTNLHKNEETISASLTYLPSGVLTDVGYVFAENTMITPAEIEVIDNRIRSEIKASFSGPTYKTNPVINIPIGFAF